MNLWFSGVESRDELAMLMAAGIRRILLDPQQFIRLRTEIPAEIGLTLDSGAFKAFKSGHDLDLDDLLSTASSYSFQWVAAPDKIGDWELSYLRWKRMKDWQIPYQLLPIWQWDAPDDILQEMLDAAPLVGIGGCQPWLFVKPAKEQSTAELVRERDHRNRQFEKLKNLCDRHGQQVHIFGLCWEFAIEELASTLASADTSHWLVGARAGKVLFKNRRTEHLSSAPARVLPEASRWDRTERCINNAKVLAHFLGEPGNEPIAL